MIPSNNHPFSDVIDFGTVSFTDIEQAIAHEAPTIDDLGVFPHSSISRLADAGLVKWTLAEDHDYSTLCDLLIWSGRASLTVGRLFEGHLNGLILLKAYNNSQKQDFTRAETEAGRITGVWNAERGSGLSAQREQGGWILTGTKIYCSGAGAIRYPIVTARIDGSSDVLMMMPDMDTKKASVDTSKWKPAGMRGTTSGTVSFNELYVPDSAVIGKPGDYYKSPLFSGGASRVLAVQLGGLQNLVGIHARRIIETNSFDKSNTRLRFALTTQKLEMARLLVMEALRRADDAKNDAASIDAYVDSARSAFESLALDIIQNTRRNLGLSSFIRPDPIDLVIRDLETYLRQPFLDASCDHAATYLLHKNGSFVR